ncbi:MAG: RNA polymerase sigma factor [Actinomycetota bacterium]
MGAIAGDGDSDAALLRGANSDPEGFGRFYLRHVDAVLAFHYRRTGCRETAADLTAETFAAAYLARRRFRPGPRPARAWLFGIARNQLSKFARRQRVADRARRRLGIPPLSPSDEDFERIEYLIDLQPVGDALREAIAVLPSSQAEAVWLRVGHQRSFAEVALALGCSEGAARVRVSRGLRRLADAMEQT